MSFIAKSAISLAAAGAAFALYKLIPALGNSDGGVALLFLLATALTAFAVGSTGSPASSESASYSDHDSDDSDSDDSDREEGEVKWFNVSKGFGFITRDEGGEIFVHFRSIRGEGRRSLRDGQRVSFRVEDSEKGLQAEDVEGL